MKDSKSCSTYPVRSPSRGECLGSHKSDGERPNSASNKANFVSVPKTQDRVLGSDEGSALSHSVFSTGSLADCRCGSVCGRPSQDG